MHSLKRRLVVSNVRSTLAFGGGAQIEFDAVARLDCFIRKPAPVDLECVSRRHLREMASVRVFWNHILNFEDFTLRIQKSDRKRNERVAHPEPEYPVACISEQHAAVWRQTGAMGKATLMTDAIAGHFCGQRVTAYDNLDAFVVDWTAMSGVGVSQHDQQQKKLDNSHLATAVARTGQAPSSNSVVYRSVKSEHNDMWRMSVGQP